MDNKFPVGGGIILLKRSEQLQALFLMRIIARGLALLALASTFSSATASQSRPEVDVSGSVVTEGSRIPVPDVIVVFTPRSSSSRGILRTSTDTSGRFTFKGLQPGPYRLVASHDGFVDFTQTIDLQDVKGSVSVGIALAKTGAISGELKDRNGAPLVGAHVRIVKPVYDALGYKQLKTVGNGDTDDRGYFRVSALQPGKYHVAASLPANPPLRYMPRFSDAGDEAYVPTYYPGVSEIADAPRVELKSGEEVGPLRFELSWRSVYRIRGTVTKAESGGSVTAISLSVVPKDGGDPLPLLAQTYNNADGSFELRGIGAGDYWLQAAVGQGRQQSTIQQSTTSLRTTIGASFQNVLTQASGVKVPIQVVRSDINGVRIVLGDLSIQISGEIVSESGQPLPNVVVRLQAFGNGPVSGSPGYILGRLDGDKPGSFTTYTVPLGKYRVMVDNVPAGVYISRIRLGDTLIPDNAITVDGRVSDRLRIELSSRGAEVSGVALADNRPVADAQMVLIPNGRRERVDLYKVATSDQLGRFSMNSIVPGEYRLFAWSGFEPYSYFDPDLLEKFRGRSVDVNVVEADRLSVSVRPIIFGDQ